MPEQRKRKHVLVTGVAGFIGFHVAKRLMADGYGVTGVDALLPVHLGSKLERLRVLDECRIPDYTFRVVDLADRSSAEALFEGNRFDYVIHLAAKTGVRGSVQDPRGYARANIDAFLNVLEGCRQTQVEKLVYASSSSVYGNHVIPMDESEDAREPESFYGATKVACEAMAAAFSSQYNLKSVGLRYFTVYGPYGREDMSVYLFTKQILNGETVTLYGDGKLERDFTYIDDIVDGTVKAMLWSCPPVLNLGRGSPVRLGRLVYFIEKATQIDALLEAVPDIPIGDVLSTCAATFNAAKYLGGWMAKVDIEEGIRRFVEWYMENRRCKPKSSDAVEQGQDPARNH